MIKIGLAKFGFFRIPLAVSLPVVLATTAFAQEPSPPTSETAPSVRTFNANGTEETSTERVIVTGSAIPTAGEVGPNPVLNVTRDLINKSGERNTEELLRNLPVANANGVAVSNNENGSNTAVGAATIALRGFDARATLILLDGRRVAPYPTGNRRVVFVDLNTIPEASIESIEILKDGASTTYGADAVAGVVNIKRFHDYRGAEARVEYGNTTDRDSGMFNTSLLFGVGDGKSNISGTINYYHRNSIFNHDRSYSAVPPFLSSNASPYNLQVTNAAVAQAGGTVIPSGSGNQFASAPNGTNGLAPASTYLYGAGRPRSGPNGFNFNEFSLSFPDSERFGGYMAMDHKIFGDQFVIYADGMYQNVKTHNELAAPATGNFQSPGFTTLAIPPRVPNPAGTTPFGGPTYAETGVTPGAFNPFNPFNQIISGGTRARLAEFGNRKFDNESDAYLGTIGFRGDKLFDGSWGYDTGFRYSQIRNTTTGTQVSISRFNRILNQADPIFNPASSQYIGTTVAFNPFGDFRVPIASNAASIEFARVHPRDIDTSKLATLDGTLYTTDLFTLPAGGIGFAVGGQFRRESLNEDPDQLNIAGDISGNSSIATARGGRKSYGIFVETSIPIFSEKNAIPGFHAFDISAAGRYEEFRNNNTNVAVPKIGARWQPFDNSFTLRFTWGKGFREPSLEELYSAPISDIQPSHDPKNGGAFEPETTTLIQSSPNLAPEDSETFSGGFVWTPKFMPGLTISTDLWQIDRTGVVQSAFLDAVLAREVAGTLLPGERVERLPDGSITRIVVSNRNEASQKANGVDFGLQYQYPTESFGTFTSITQVTYLNSFEVQRVAGGPIEQLAGVTTDPGASQEGYYRWRGNSRLDWAWKGFDLIGTVRLISGFIELDADGNTRNVDRRWLFDIQASYDFSALVTTSSETSPNYSKDAKAPASTVAASEMSFWDYLLKGTTFTVGCNNLFDKDPPFASGFGGNATGYPGFTYDSTGRFYYVRLTKKF
ncbi:MAG: iron complex outerrane recepter protein [Verrucomicrobiota bacterium]|jgi:outer membrane receptor protein involved in Fe transport